MIVQAQEILASKWGCDDCEVQLFYSLVGPEIHYLIYWKLVCVIYTLETLHFGCWKSQAECKKAPVVKWVLIKRYPQFIIFAPQPFLSRFLLFVFFHFHCLSLSSLSDWLSLTLNIQKHLYALFDSSQGESFWIIWDCLHHSFVCG